MNCIIVDDEEMSRQLLKSFCEKIEDLSVVEICENAIQAIRALKEHEIDLMFLDIEMPDVSGMDLVKSLGNLPQIIFITSRSDYAMEAFEYNVTDYLAKPVQLPRLMKAVERAREQYINKQTTNHTLGNAQTPIPQGSENEIYIKVDGRYVRLKYDDILYVETVGDYVLFRTEKEKHIVYSTLKNIEERLQHPKFLKVHRSYIVNLSKIVDIEETSLVIANKVIPVSRAHRPVLMSRINLL